VARTRVSSAKSQAEAKKHYRAVERKDTKSARARTRVARGEMKTKKRRGAW